MRKRYCYQSEGEKLSISVRWWFVILSVAILWLWKYDLGNGLFIFHWSMVRNLSKTRKCQKFVN